MGVILHSDISHLPQVLPWQPFVMNVLQDRKVNKLAYLAGYWLDLAQIWYRGYFWILNQNQQYNFYTTSF